MLINESYKELGYSDYMVRPFIGKSNKLSPMEVKSMFPMGSINFGQASGGTLTLGGKDDAGGIMSVLDSTASEKVLIDQNGITITGGKITIQDSLGSTVIDSVGLVSDTSFTFDSVEGVGGTLTDNVGTWTDITGVTLTFSLARAAQVLFLYQSTGFIDRNLDDITDVSCHITLTLDSAAVGTQMEAQGTKQVASWGAAATRGSTDMVWNQGNGSFVMSHYSDSLATGTHTAKLQFRTSTGGCTATIWRALSRLSYIVLGK